MRGTNGPRKFCYGNIVLFIGSQPPDRKPFENAPNANPLIVKDGLLKSGDSLWWDIVDVSMVEVDRIRAVFLGETDDFLFIIGRVHFLDSRDNKRQTVFCRVFDPSSSRFKDADIPDYEYQA